MKMIDVGEEIGGEMAVPTSSKKEIYYPCLHLRGVDIESLREVGKDVTLTIKGSIKSVREDEEDCDVEIEVRQVGIPDGKNKADEAMDDLSKSKSRY